MSMAAYKKTNGAALSAFQGKRAWQICALGSFFTLFFVIRFMQASLSEMAQTGDVTVNNDFRVFWAAGKIALESRVLSIFDNSVLASVHREDQGAWMPWLYPPGYLLLITPLGVLSFGLAWIVFVLISVAVMALALRPFARQSMPLWLACVFAPAFAPALVMGQNSLVWGAGLLTALWALRTDRRILAGVIIGLLTLKPQLGLLIPFALLAIGAWRTIAVATITAILIAALPTLIYGVDYWIELHEILGAHGLRVRENIEGLSLLIGLFSVLTEFGLSVHDALSVQWGVAAVCAALVFVVWRQPAIGWDLKAALLLAATMLGVPYLWHYETALFVPLGLFMLRAGVLKANLPGYGMLLVLWIGISPIIVAAFLELKDAIPTARSVAAPVILGSFLLILRTAWLSSRRPAPTIRTATRMTHD